MASSTNGVDRLKAVKGMGRTNVYCCAQQDVTGGPNEDDFREGYVGGQTKQRSW